MLNVMPGPSTVPALRIVPRRVALDAVDRSRLMIDKGTSVLRFVPPSFAKLTSDFVWRVPFTVQNERLIKRLRGALRLQGFSMLVWHELGRDTYAISVKRTRVRLVSS